MVGGRGVHPVLKLLDAGEGQHGQGDDARRGREEPGSSRWPASLRAPHGIERNALTTSQPYPSDRGNAARHRGSDCRWEQEWGVAYTTHGPDLRARSGGVAEWLGKGLQNPVHRFNSGPRLEIPLRRIGGSGA